MRVWLCDLNSLTRPRSRTIRLSSNTRYLFVLSLFLFVLFSQFFPKPPADERVDPRFSYLPRSRGKVGPVGIKLTPKLSRNMRRATSPDQICHLATMLARMHAQCTPVDRNSRAQILWKFVVKSCTIYIQTQYPVFAVILNVPLVLCKLRWNKTYVLFVVCIIQDSRTQKLKCESVMI